MVYIIAEAGVNHDGSVAKAVQLVEAARKAGADCVKFQTFKASNVASKEAPKADYQLKVTSSDESQHEMLRKLELQHDDYKAILRSCQLNQIDFMSTPYSFDDADYLDTLGVSSFKIASGQLTELPFLQYVARKNKRMIISTGMSTLADVFSAVMAIREVGNNNIVVLQCTTNYPSDIEDANVLAMVTIHQACKVQVGYSDHVQNNFACYAAVALGAQIIEKHITLDKASPGPDHSTSLDPDEFKELVTGIRNVERALGTGIKVPSLAETKNSFGMKRSLVAKKNLAQGTVLEVEHIAFKRPASGMEVNMLNQVVGKKLKIDLYEDEPLTFNSIDW